MLQISMSSNLGQPRPIRELGQASKEAASSICVSDASSTARFLDGNQCCSDSGESFVLLSPARFASVGLFELLSYATTIFRVRRESTTAVEPFRRRSQDSRRCFPAVVIAGTITYDQPFHLIFAPIAPWLVSSSQPHFLHTK